MASHLQIDSDPDPVYYFDADPDPDPAYHFDADAVRIRDPTFQFDVDPDPQHCVYIARERGEAVVAVPMIKVLLCL